LLLVLHLATVPAKLIWEREFSFNADKLLLVGCMAAR